MDFFNTASGIPPPGVTPNFVDPPTQAPIAIVVVTVTLPLMIVFVALRLYADVWISRKLDRVSWACLIAMAASISYCSVIYFTLSQHILGRHIWDVPVVMNTESAVQNFTVLNILYGPVAFLAKISVLVLYLRVFGVLKQTRIFTYIAIAVNFAQCLAQIIGSAAVCAPAPGQSWAIAAATYDCRVTGGFLGVIMAAISIFNDFFIIIIPIPAICSLQLATKKKIGVCAIFFVGLFVCVASILNLVYRIQLWRSPLHDNTWNGVISYMLTVVEINVAIMCSCMPSYSAYIRRHLQTFRRLKSHIRVGSSWGFSFRKRSSKLNKHSDSEKVNGAERIPSHEEDARNHPLTLGSAIRDGRFLKTGDRSQFVQSQYMQSGDHLRLANCHQSGKTCTQKTQSLQSEDDLRSSSGGLTNTEKIAHLESMV